MASLRLVAGRYPDDPGFAALIGELSVKSDEFAELWSKHPVYKCVSGTEYLRHPEVGDFELQYELLHLPDDNGHRLMTYTAVPDSPAEAALLLLGRHPERDSAVS